MSGIAILTAKPTSSKCMQIAFAKSRSKPHREADPHRARHRVPPRGRGAVKTKTLRFRMMVLFCTVVSVLLVASYLAFWGLLAHEIPSQLNHQLQETGRLLIADVAAEPEARDIERLDIPGEFFELLDANGHVLQQSRNLPAPINLKSVDPSAMHSTFQVADIGGEQSVRGAGIPFEQTTPKRFC